MSDSPGNFGKRRVLGAAAWTLCGYGTSVLIRLGSSLIMTRLLAPEMFGFMALSMVIIQGLAMVSDVGLSQVAVTSRNFADRQFQQTLWTVQFLRGSLIFVALLTVSAILWAWGTTDGTSATRSVYLDPLFPWVLAALALGPLLTSLEPVGMLGLVRQMNARVLVGVELGVQLFTLAVMVAYALWSPTVWALVVGTVSGGLLKLAVAYRLFPDQRPGFVLDRRHLSDVLGFGKWVTLASIFGFTALSGDRLLLGMLVPAALLGLYSISHMLVTAVEQSVSKLLASVAFPVLSDAQRNRPGQIGQVHYRFAVPVTVAVWVVAWFLHQVAPLIIHALYDQRYAPAADIFSWLSLLLLAAPLRLSLHTLMATGDARPTAIAAAVRTLVSLAGAIILYPLLGLQGVAIAAVLGAGSVAPLAYRALYSRGLLQWRRELLAIPAGALGYALGAVVLRQFQ